MNIFISGVGKPLIPERCRMLLALRINVLAKGYSGLSLETLQQVIEAFNGNTISVFLIFSPDFSISNTIVILWKEVKFPLTSKESSMKKGRQSFSLLFAFQLVDYTLNKQ